MLTTIGPRAVCRSPRAIGPATVAPVTGSTAVPSQLPPRFPMPYPMSTRPPTTSGSLTLAKSGTPSGSDHVHASVPSASWSRDTSWPTRTNTPPRSTTTGPLAPGPRSATHAGARSATVSGVNADSNGLWAVRSALPPGTGQQAVDASAARSAGASARRRRDVTAMTIPPGRAGTA